jgi:uncharacterized protein YehS (DUF1456 family)
MTNNEVLRGMRYALDLRPDALAEIFKLSGRPVEPGKIISILKKEGEEGFSPCADALLEDFLTGLIISRRGRREGTPAQTTRAAEPLTNNFILKKLRIAMELQEEDMLGILKQAGSPVSKSELSALFRKAGHKNYKECGDQFLRNFLKGLALRYRPAARR